MENYYIKENSSLLSNEYRKQQVKQQTTGRLKERKKFVENLWKLLDGKVKIVKRLALAQTQNTSPKEKPWAQALHTLPPIINF